MARKFKILVKRKDNRFQKYTVTDKTFKERYRKGRITKEERKQFKQLKRKRVFFERRPAKYVKWVGLEMGVKSRGRPLVAWFGFTREIKDVDSFSRAVKNIESLDKTSISNKKIKEAIDVGTQQDWLDATDGFVYDAFVQSEEPSKTNMFVYDGRSGNKLVYSGRFRAWTSK